MADMLTQETFQLLREYIERECGIHLGDDKQYLVENRLRDILLETGSASFADLYMKARADSTSRVRDFIVEAMTTHETLWFRDGGPFDVFRETLLPRFAEEIARGERDKIRIWSAGCSTGQEPYSLAIIYNDFITGRTDLGLEHLEILATDISEIALRSGRVGEYSAMAMARGLGDDFKERHFEQKGRRWAIKQEIRDLVTFEHHNLQDDAIASEQDIIMARYVAIYFSDRFKRELFLRLRQAIRPGGCLFLGSSESLGECSEGYELVHEGRSVYFRVPHAEPAPAGN